MMNDKDNFNREDTVLGNSEVRFFASLLSLVLLVFIISLLSGPRLDKGDFGHSEDLVQREFPAVTLQARSAYVYDMRERTVLYALNEDDALPLASLSKVMASLVALKNSRDTDTVLINAEALLARGDSGLVLGDRWSLGALLKFSLISSSNDAMRAVALAVGSRASASSSEALSSFVSLMNREAVAVGMEKTFFKNETGLDESDFEAGAFGSAKDVNALMDYVFRNHPELLRPTSEKSLPLRSLSGVAYRAENTNLALANIPGVLASKTGFTNMAGGNLSVIFDPELGRPIIVTVLGSTAEGRFQDVEKLVLATLTYLQQ